MAVIIGIKLNAYKGNANPALLNDVERRIKVWGQQDFEDVDAVYKFKNGDCIYVVEVNVRPAPDAPYVSQYAAFVVKYNTLDRNAFNLTYNNSDKYTLTEKTEFYDQTETLHLSYSYNAGVVNEAVTLVYADNSPKKDSDGIIIGRMTAANKADQKIDLTLKWPLEAGSYVFRLIWADGQMSNPFTLYVTEVVATDEQEDDPCLGFICSCYFQQ